MNVAQQWSADGYAHHARFVADLGVDVLALLDAREGERILDLGCGDGVLTQRLTEAGIDVVGADSSSELVAAAVELGIDARLVDGHALAFEHEFDAVFSNAALHWMLQPEDVIAGVRRALRPAGRFVGEFGGHGNVAAIRVALDAALRRVGVDAASLDPWFFPTPDRYRGLLEAAGFRVVSIGLVARPTLLPTDMRGWLATFANPFVAGLSVATRHGVIDEVEGLLAPVLCDEKGQWTADYVRLRFAAELVR
jgi:SAM-dependent methyltransferase